MEVGRLACERAGVPIDKYYSSEIDKYAIQVSKANWPDIIHLGDVTKVYGCTLPDIHLLLGGSPCQDLRPGRGGLKGPKSKLFYEYVRVKREIEEYNPKLYFGFENTAKIKIADKTIITELLGVEPVLINSALLGAQNRLRYYWSNIPFLGQPDDKGITLSSIIEIESPEKYNVTNKFIERFKRKHPNFTGKINPEKTGTLNTGNNSGKGCIDRGTTLLKVIAHSSHTRQGRGQGGKGPLQREDGKSYCLDTSIGTYIQYGDVFRRLMPVECERLQTIPDNYSACVSDNQRYIMLGNAWHADTIKHLLLPLGDYSCLF